MHRGLVAAGKGHHGHGPDHDLQVAAYCLRIGTEEFNAHTAGLAYIAAMIHSIDRFFPKEEVLPRVESMVASTKIGMEDALVVVRSIMEHDGQNDAADHPAKVVLMDADRLANIGPSIIIRSGQFLSKLPVAEAGYTDTTRHPESTYKAPRSVHDDLLGCLEWEHDGRFGLRTKTAKRIGAPLFEFLKEFLARLDEQYRLIGW